MRDVVFSKQAERFLLGLPTKQARQIATRIQALAVDDDAVPTQELQGYAPLRRLKSGEFRVIFAIEGDELSIKLIGKRNDDQIYKMLVRGNS